MQHRVDGFVDERSAEGSGRAWQLALLVVAGAGAALATRAVSPVQETMRTALSLSDNDMAMLQGPALALPIVLLAIPLGIVIDRYSRVRLLLVLAIMNIAGSVLTAMATSFSALFIARCIVGLAATAVTITSFSLVADLYPAAQRGRAKGLVVVGQFAGQSTAFALGGALLMSLGTGHDWRLSVLWLTGPALLAVLLMMFALREPPRTGVLVQKPSSRQTLVELWNYRAVVASLIAGIVLTEMPLLVILTWAAPALSRGYSLKPDAVGAIIGTAMALGGLVGPMLGGALADFCQRSGGPPKTMAMLAFISLLGIPGGFFAVMPGVASASTLLVLCCLVSTAALAMAVTLFTITIPNEMRGLCLAILATLDALFAAALAPLLVSMLSEAIGGPAMIGKALAGVCVTVSVLAAATFAGGRLYVRACIDSHRVDSSMSMASTKP